MGAQVNKPWAHSLLEGGFTSCFVVSGVVSSSKSLSPSPPFNQWAVFLTGLGFKASRFKPPQFRHHTPALFVIVSVVSNIA
jgi:hypothetical protein